jgi:putative SOS response-associated peptidase YedK
VCGRYTLAAPVPGQLRARFPVGESVPIVQRYNVAPGDEVLAVTTDREGAPRGELLRWGLVPAWADSPNVGLKLINARIETAAEKPTFRTALERFRCLIIADGFYEWQPQASGPKHPFWITRSDHEPFAFAGLWSVWKQRGPDGEVIGEPLRTCTICTTEANPKIAPLHSRMPVILAPDAEAAWLDAKTPVPVLRELAVGLDAVRTGLKEVGTAVNDARYDGPACLDDPTPDPQASLF